MGDFFHKKNSVDQITNFAKKKEMTNEERKRKFPLYSRLIEI